MGGSFGTVLNSILVSDYSVKNIAVNSNSVSCRVSGKSKTTSPTLYAVLYNGNEFIEARVVKNASGNITLPFTKLSQADSFKLILMDASTFAPLYTHRFFNVDN